LQTPQRYGNYCVGEACFFKNGVSRLPTNNFSRMESQAIQQEDPLEALRSNVMRFVLGSRITRLRRELRAKLGSATAK